VRTSKSIVMLIVVVFYCSCRLRGWGGVGCDIVDLPCDRQRLSRNTRILVLVARSCVGMRSELCNVRHRLAGT
jgi:hypothetical protein